MGKDKKTKSEDLNKHVYDIELDYVLWLFLLHPQKIYPSTPKKHMAGYRISSASKAFVKYTDKEDRT